MISLLGGSPSSAMAATPSELFEPLPEAAENSVRPDTLSPAQVETFFRLQVELGSQLYLAGDLVGAKATWEKLVSQQPALKQIFSQAESQLALLALLEQPSALDLREAISRLNRRYLEGAGYEELSASALQLLERTKSAEIRREIKRIADLAWSREELQLAAALLGAVSACDPGVPPGPCLAALDSLRRAHPRADGRRFDEARAGLLAARTPTPETGRNAESRTQQADSLLAMGLYLRAGLALESIPLEDRGRRWQSLRQKSGALYCTEKRKVASALFSKSQKKGSLPARKAALAGAMAELDSCVQAFPEPEISLKARQNLELLRGHIDKAPGN